MLGPFTKTRRASVQEGTRRGVKRGVRSQHSTFKRRPDVLDLSQATRDPTAAAIEVERVSKFQFCQCDEGQRGDGKPCARPRYVCIHDMAGHEEAAFRVGAHSRQNAASSCSGNTRFGSTRSPKVRRARASISGHFTRFALPRAVFAVGSSNARTARTNFRRSRAGSAFTCLRSSIALLPGG